MKNRRPIGAISRTGWLFADLFLVLAIVFLGTQGTVPTQRVWYLSQPVHPRITINSAGLLSGDPSSIKALKSSLLNSVAGPQLRKGAIIGLVITFAGGPGCDNGGAMSTSLKINDYLATIFPLSYKISTSEPGPTQSQAYINLGCSGANHADMQLFFWKMKVINR